MTNGVKTLFGVVVSVAIISFALIFIFSLVNKKSETDTTGNDLVPTELGGTAEKDNLSSSYKEKLAKYLAEQGMVMYGGATCAHCKEQKALFGDSVQYIDYVECEADAPNANPEECTAQGITNYPTWVYKGEQFVGLKQLSELAKIVGFSE